jgi:ankyrin repeat protein
MFCSSEQFTALHLAANNGHLAVCEVLIAGKADVNAKTMCAFTF